MYNIYIYPVNNTKKYSNMSKLSTTSTGVLQINGNLQSVIINGTQQNISLKQYSIDTKARAYIEGDFDISDSIIGINLYNSRIGDGVINMINTFKNCYNLVGSPICGNNVIIFKNSNQRSKIDALFFD
jgi:hypothetical protein